MKKHPYVLSSLLLVSVLASSCGGGAADTKPDDTDVQSPQISEAADGDAETTAAEELPSLVIDERWDGEDVTMLVRSEFLYEFLNDDTADVVNDAIYKRQLAVEELLGINLKIADITGTFSTKDKYLGELKSSVLAGDGAYDIAASAANYMLPVIPDGLFHDLAGNRYIDLSKEWWSQGYVENMEIDGSLYLATGSISVNSLDNMCVMFFNKKMREDMALENPYELVNAGTWTFDKQVQMSHAVTSDINGDSVISADDRVGCYSYNNMCIAQTISFGLDFSKRGDDGYPYITYLSDRMVTAFDRFRDFRLSSDYLEGKQDGQDTLDLTTVMQQKYQNGNMFIMAQVLSSAKVMRGMDVDFGIIPMPKLDESQERYYTCAMENLTVVGIPSSVENTDRAGAVIEAMAIDGYNSITPAYFESALKGKYARDNESAEMLELIRDSLWFDFAYLNSVSLNDINHLFNNSIIKGKEITSAFEAQKEKIEKNLAKLLDGYASLKQ